MVKVKVILDYFDKELRENKVIGDVFETTEDRADVLVYFQVAEILEAEEIEKTEEVTEVEEDTTVINADVVVVDEPEIIPDFSNYEITEDVAEVEEVTEVEDDATVAVDDVAAEETTEVTTAKPKRRTKKVNEE